MDACGDELVEFTNIEYAQEHDDIQSHALFDDYETESNDSGWLEAVHDDQSYSEEDDQSDTEEDDQSHTEEDDQRQPEEDDPRQPEEDEASLDEILGGRYESESAADNEMKGDSGIIHLKYAIVRGDKQVSKKKGLVHIIKKRTSRISVPAFLRRTKHGVSVDGANKNEDQSSERRCVSPLLVHDEGNLKDKLKVNRIGFRVQSFMRKEKSPRKRDNAEAENLEAVGTSTAKPSEDQRTKRRSVSPVLVRDEDDNVKVKSKQNRIGFRVHSFLRKEKAKRDEEGDEISDAVGASLAKLRADQRSKHVTDVPGLVQDEGHVREESPGNRAIFGLQSLQRNEKAKATREKEDTRDDLDSYIDDISMESSVSGSRGTSVRPNCYAIQPWCCFAAPHHFPNLF
jgi:hypothetical protein